MKVHSLSTRSAMATVTRAVQAAVFLAVVALTVSEVVGQHKNIFEKPTKQSEQPTAPAAVEPEVIPAATPVPAPVVASVAVADTTGSFTRPKYAFLRHAEDWSGLAGRDTSQTGDSFDSIKHIPLSQDGSVWASLGGHVRARSESWGRFGFGGATNDNDSFTLVRLLLHADVHFGDHFRFYVEGKTAGSTQRKLPGGHRTLDVDSLDLEQSFFDLKFDLKDDALLTLRGGRQQLLFGKQRLVSPLPWGNTLRRWDGIQGILESGGWKLSGFYTQFAPTQKYRFNDPDAQHKFSGVYATNAAEGVDLYWLFLDRDDPRTFNGTTGDEERHTLGGRIWGKDAQSGFDFDIEGAYQVGELGSADIQAYMIAAEFGLKVGHWFGSPRFHLGLDYASGDDTAGDRDVETFNHLFPLGHAFLGYIDTIGRQNIFDFSAGVTFKPADKLLVKITGHLFWRADDNDALYNAGGGVVRAGSLGNNRRIGSEIDLLAKYPFTRHLTGVFGYSHFFADDFLEQSGAHRDVDFVYVIMQYTF